MANSHSSRSSGGGEGLHRYRPGKEPVGEPSAILALPLSANIHISGTDSLLDVSEIVRSVGLDDSESYSGIKATIVRK